MTTLVLTKADGFWEEIAKPFEQHNPNNGTHPHMVTGSTRETSKIGLSLLYLRYQYKSRTAGTALDNPSMYIDGASITEVNYYKNRLFFLTSVGTVISSKAGEIDNFFLNTAIDISVIDPIDVIANSEQRVPIHGSAIVNNAMVLFGDSEQYML